MSNDPHANAPMHVVGTLPETAKAVMILIHGRGASAESILDLRNEFDANGFSFIAPQATQGTWYPQRFIAPKSANEPWLSSAMNLVTGIINNVESKGIPSEKIMLLGFSQGACLAAEVVARNPKRYGGLAVLSGGLIGTDAELIGFNGDLAGTPVFLGCSDVDFHIPKERVNQSADIFRELGAGVTARLYPNMGHTINQDELDAVQAMMTDLVS